jgi:hypothetical protein
MTDARKPDIFIKEGLKEFADYLKGKTKALKFDDCMAEWEALVEENKKERENQKGTENNE